MNRTILFALLMACAAANSAEPSRQFLRFSETLRIEPNWQTSQGTATVRIEENSIRIEAFDVEGFNEGVGVQKICPNQVAFFCGA